jgi:hypothetical protein
MLSGEEAVIGAGVLVAVVGAVGVTTGAVDMGAKALTGFFG